MPTPQTMTPTALAPIPALNVSAADCDGTLGLAEHDRPELDHEKPDERAVPGEPGLSADLVHNRFIELIPRDFARQHLIISQGGINGRARLAVAKSTDPAATFNVGVRLGAKLDVFEADAEQIARTIDEAYGHGTDKASVGVVDESVQGAAGDSIDQLLVQADRDLLSTQGKGPVIKLVDALLFEALNRKASDIHVQPLADRTLVRYRLDGVLHTVRELPANGVTSAVISRIKVMGRMDIAERRIPQDGRSTVTIGDRAIDLRISTLPTSYGERAVLR